jgi:hypothetical protein
MIRAIILALAILVAGCSTLTAPQSFDQRVAYAYGSVTATLHTCASLYERRRITTEQGQKCLTLTDQAAAALALAQGTEDAQTAQGFLAVALGFLTQLETMLAEAQR